VGDTFFSVLLSIAAFVLLEAVCNAVFNFKERLQAVLVWDRVSLS
jgi:hypothetical protein